MLTSGIQFHKHKHSNGTFYTSLFGTKTILLIDDEEQEYKPDLHQTSLGLHTFHFTDILYWAEYEELRLHRPESLKCKLK